MIDYNNHKTNNQAKNCQLYFQRKMIKISDSERKKLSFYEIFTIFHKQFAFFSKKKRKNNLTNLKFGIYYTISERADLSNPCSGGGMADALA